VSQPIQAVGEVRLVYCLSIDLIESTLPGLRMTQGELDRFNRALVAQIEPHLEALAFDDLLVKFTGDGWLLMSPELKDGDRLCALAVIMRQRFGRDMQERTGLPETRIPALRMAICTGRDNRVQAWRGGFDWVGDSARRATRSADFCYPNEILVDGAVHGLVMRDFMTQRIDPSTRPVRPGRKRPEEDLPLWSLGELRIEAAEDWEAAAAYVYALSQLGRTDDASEASRRAADSLGSEESILPAAGDGRSIRSWNRLIANAPTYDVLLELLARLMESQAQPNIDTLNVLVDRSPTLDESLRWIADLERSGVRPDVVTFNTLIRRSPDFSAAVAFMEDMDEAGVSPTPATLRTMVDKAPSAADCYRLLRLFSDRGVAPDVDVFGRMIARAPAYESAVELYEGMRSWGVAPDATVMNRLISGAPDYDAAAGWLEVMDEQRIAADVNTFNSLIARAPRYGSALRWLEVMTERGVAPDVTTFNTVMAHAPSHEVAVSLLRTMESADVHPGSETFKTLISRSPDYATAVGWLAEMGRRGLRPNNEVFRALIAQSDDYETAQGWLDEMPIHDVAPNTETFRELMARAPDYTTARGLLDVMIAKGAPPTAETFKTLATFGPDVADAAELLDLMPAAGVRPNADLFTPFILKASTFDEARRWLERMGEHEIAPKSETMTALMRRADDYAQAVAVLEELSPLAAPNEGGYRALVELAPDFATAKGWVETMAASGLRPSVGLLKSLLSRDRIDAGGDELLRWYLGLSYHPSAPMQSAIDSYREAGRISDAMRLALDYPHLEAARTLFRLHTGEALDYLTAVVEDDPGHANGQYALGLALLELDRTKEALAHLELAREVARPGPRVAALDEVIRHARDEMPV
jgi:tetratricopeptide (TPR) repeat protein